MRYLFIALLLSPAVALAADRLAPEQLEQLVAILKADRAAYLEEVDSLRLTLAAAAAAAQERAEHDREVDAYWRRYVGLDEEKK